MRTIAPSPGFALAVVGLSSVLAGLTVVSRLNAAVLREAASSSMVGRCQYRAYTCPAGLTPSSGQCTPMLREIACDDTYCLADATRCFPWGSQNANGSATSYPRPTLEDEQASDVCIIRAFECRDGAVRANCFKRLRATDIRCDDPACADGDCVPRERFFANDSFAPWDTGALPGSFPRTETMCSLGGSACADGDDQCLRDLALRQVRCDDARCADGTASCTRTTVLVDAQDNLVRLPMSAGTSSVIPALHSTDTERQNDDENARDLPFTIDFPTQRQPIDTRSSSSSSMPRSIEQRPDLGCFARDGTWTRDRADCDPNQLQYIELQRGKEPSAPISGGNERPHIFEEPAEADIRSRIEERFFPAPERAAQRERLLHTIDEAIARLSEIVARQILPSEASIHAIETITWLRNIQATFATGDHSADDMRRQAEDVRVRLSSIRTLIYTALDQSHISGHMPDDLLDKMDRVIGALSGAFSILQEENIAIPPAAAASWVNVRRTYEEIKPACQANESVCVRLAEVVDMLDTTVNILKEAVAAANRPEIEDRIRALIRTQ